MIIISDRTRGFTLVEVAMVLFIIGLLLGGLLVPFAASVEHKNRANTEKNLQEIKDALYGFAVVNGRLPCPDCEISSASCTGGTPDDGREDLNLITNNCSIPVGNLPWATLNVPQLDAWGYVFTYRVTAAFSRSVTAYTATPPCSSVPPYKAAFDLCTLGNMNISKTDGGTANVAQNIPAIVISHGKNHYASVQQAEEIENYERNPRIFGSNTAILSSYSGDDANAFVYMDYTLSDGVIMFDDLMIWISPFILKNKLINAGKLP
jgi:prepilin-type N-terminal cleavage/methylation domain-containing protein